VTQLLWQRSINPEQQREYPEPSFFGQLPAQGLLVRYAKNVTLRHVEITSIQTDSRPFAWLSDVDGADFSGLNLTPRDNVPALRLHDNPQPAHLDQQRAVTGAPVAAS
jgi:hypothetical protein